MSAAKLGLKSQLLVAIALFVGLFFLEYPPIFLAGYWSWGALAHKALTGALVVVNLLATRYAARRLGLFGAQQVRGSERRG